MFFKTLEIQGFKSFADKTLLTFDAKTTAIIGSNGNGKSNISDALRWVMGEMGAKTLRGDKMEDVIFHGTLNRRQMGFAAVTLSVDNTDRALSINADEVIIARKLYRSGESEYLINNQKSRLKDVHELFMGTGLGRDGYSIIGQGRVAEIINSKGRERREVFEEAAGVSKFLHKKAEAERELTRANDNMLRLLDIASELEERLPVLEKQAEKAVKARGYIEREKSLEISVSVNELRKTDRELLETEDKILANEGECEHYDREIKKLEDETKEKSEEKMRLAMKLDELRRSSDNARDEIAAADKEAAVDENEIIHNEARRAVINEQILNSIKSEKEFDRQTEETQNKIDEKNNELSGIKLEIEKKQFSLNEASDENRELDSDYKLLDRELAALFGKQTEARVSLSAAESSLEEIKNSLGEAAERTQNQDGLILSYREKRQALKNILEENTASKQETENKLSGYGRLYSAKKEKMDGMSKELDKLKQETDRKKSRLDILSDVERNMAGYYGSVKSIISASKTGKMSGIHGTVADIIRVDNKYSVAVEIALGASLQNIIVNDEEVAKRSIRFLKDTNAGRATFLPLTSIKGRTLDASLTHELMEEDGYLGLGHEVIKYDLKYGDIIKSVLGKTVITDDIDSATFLAKKYGYKFRIVTLDGQIINAGGSFTGGSVKESAGIITRKHEIETLTNELGVLGDTLDLARGNFSQLKAEVNKMSLEIEGFKESLAALNGEEIRLTAEISGVTNLIKQCEEQQDNAELIINKHKSQIAAQEAVIEKYINTLAKLENDITVKEKEAEEMSGKLKRTADRHRETAEKITQLNLEVLSAEKDIESLNQRIKTINENKKSLSEGEDKLKGEIKQLEDLNISLTEKIKQTRDRIISINKSSGENQKEILEITEKNNGIEQRLTALNKEIRSKIEEKEKFSNALVLAKERKSNILRDAEKIKTSLWEKYELTPNEAKNLAAPFTAQAEIREAKNELVEVRRKLSALGNVNFAAIEEFDEVGERYKILSAQLKDLEKSKFDLEKLIQNLTEDIKTNFINSFNDINMHFGRIFREIFGGGSAHLELTDPDDILGSGIEIFAAPPGKLIKSLLSLSGGEQTLVAITIYFAILQHRPTPFCMLDEVDAALDEANVVKYITYLKRFSKRTQLMVITHRRGTIEGCDVLYGVFMQEKGISRLLRQEISEVL